MERGDALLIRRSAVSVRSIVSRVRAEFKDKRKFYTEKFDGGVKVWRLQ